METEELLIEKRAKLLQEFIQKITDFLKHHSVKGEISSKTFIYRAIYLF